ncbi:5'-flap endonuclease [Extremus antarcticus]|uniref:Structure-specific endonuclease subunit SLX4 n=1 Tax=Extremus antarcticus TaxID=702011 RepID=A0AAJ0D647_9PEZI|nr:5'-flap endonuclease [Extremus antarcticus]
MSAPSPVVINTSPLQSFHSPFFSPPSVPQDYTRRSSSSPSLLSPSAFVRSKAAPLKTGSGAQQVPDGVGFKSVGSLLKTKEFTFTGDEGEDGARSGSPRREEKEKTVRGEKDGGGGTGKLVRPRKKRKTEDVDREEVARLLGGSVTERLENFRHRANLEAVGIQKLDTAMPTCTTDDPTALAQAQTHSRKPSVALSDYVFDGIDAPKPAEPHVRPTKAKATPKPRKPRVRKADATDKEATKKPRKRKAKSASFILNSDEPEQTDAGAPPPAVRQPACQPPAESDPEAPVKFKGFGAFVFERDHHEDEVSKKRSTPETTSDPLVTEQQSGYFGPPVNGDVLPAVDLQPDAASAAVLLPAPTVLDDSPALPAQAASRRRLDWTPPKETTNVTIELSPTPRDQNSPTRSPPKRQLSSVLTGFGYISDNTSHPAIPQQALPIEAKTKRRRIELGDDSTNSVTAGKVKKATLTDHAAVTKVAKPKQPKKPPKKVQTITALATAAFQPPVPPALAGTDVVSQFFAAGQDSPSAVPVAEKAAEEPPVAPKPKKPRKPRVKKADLANGEKPDKPASKPKAKPKTVKVKFNEGDHRAKLYSPGRATAQFDTQDFIFGTSSQLAVDEDAAFIRDIQAALQASESVLQPHHADTNVHQRTQAAPSPPSAEPSWKSCVRVPTAPHGTSLSVHQAEKEHWCVGARDFRGGVVRVHAIKSLSSRPVRPVKAAAGGLQDIPADARAVAHSEEIIPITAQEVDAAVPIFPTDIPQRTQSGADVIDHLPDAPTIVPGGELPDPEPPAPSQEDEKRDYDDDDDTWMLLRSDDSVIVPLRPSHETQDRCLTAPTAISSLAAPTAFRAGPQPMFQTSPLRSPLKLLDRNIPMLPALGPTTSGDFKPARMISTTSGSTTSMARASKSSPARKPGRPRKDAVNAADPLPSTKVKRKGRPPKHEVDAAREKPAASQPPESSSFLDIDEISDSDAPVTPSPPRRRARSATSTITPLKLSPLASPKLKAPLKADALAKAPAAVVPSLKVNDSHWQSVRAELFTRITQTVKSGERSTDAQRPSWWQKILLYDPIVLEDITGWLNGQGVEVGVRKKKPRVKKKGRKKKGGAEAEAPVGDQDGDVVMEEEYEIVREPLQPWMVQKWCEEMSVCCLWKGGLRGGVRVAY